MIKNIIFMVLMIIVLPINAEDYTELDCLVTPEMYIELSSPAAGVLSAVLVNKGDSIKKDQVLAQLESTVEIAKVALAKQETVMYNQVNSKEIRLSYAERKEKRVSGLVRDSALSEQEYDDAKTEKEVAKTEVIQAKLDRQKNNLKLKLAEAELAIRTIKSPITGIVVERYLMPGESVNNQPILKIAKMDPLLVEVVAPFELFGLVKQGMEIEIHPEMPREKKYKAVVTVVDQLIDAASGSFGIRLALSNSDEQLIAGSRCVARFPVTPHKPQEHNTKSKEQESAVDDLPDDIKALLRDQ